MSPIHAVLIGAGQRGAEAYAPYALTHPDELVFTAVAEPVVSRRKRFALVHKLPEDRCFESWEELLSHPSLGEAAIIATQDWLHAEPAIAAMKAGYHVLLEKPMATSPEDCRALVSTSVETGRQLHICHVLRYTRYARKMREIIQSGELGQIVDVHHRENVSFWHMAHSYVRGHWRNRQASSPMILAKCCHDLDMLPWVLGDHPIRLQSQGNLLHFRPENAPAGAPPRCTDGCPASDQCPYYAPWIYLQMAPFWHSYARTSRRPFERWLTNLQVNHPGLVRMLAGVIKPLRQVSDYRGWPLTVVAEEPSPANILQALKEGPYGRCVYHCDNDVVDHQVVSMEFSQGATVTLSMHGHSHYEHRSTRIEGSRGRLLGELGNGGAWLRVENHRSGTGKTIDTSPAPHEGHGGGDTQLMADFIFCVRQNTNSPELIRAAKEALASHLLAFCAENARLDGLTYEVGSFYAGID